MYNQDVIIINKSKRLDIEELRQDVIQYLNLYKYKKVENF